MQRKYMVSLYSFVRRKMNPSNFKYSPVISAKIEYFGIVADVYIPAEIERADIRLELSCKKKAVT